MVNRYRTATHAEQDRLLSVNAAKRADRGRLSRFAHGFAQLIGRSSTSNFLAEQRKITHEQSKSTFGETFEMTKRKATAEAHLKVWEHATGHATRLGARGGADDARYASNWNSASNIATGVSRTATALEAAEAGAATTGVLTVPAAIAAVPTELVRQGANSAANAAGKRRVRAFERATVRSEEAAQHATGYEQEYQMRSAAVYDGHRKEAIPKADDETDLDRSNLHMQVLRDKTARGDALAGITRQGMAGPMREIGQAAAKRGESRQRNLAATAIQAAIRGHQSRQNFAQHKEIAQLSADFEKASGRKTLGARFHEWWSGKPSTHTRLKNSLQKAASASTREERTAALAEAREHSKTWIAKRRSPSSTKRGRAIASLQSSIASHLDR